MSCSATKSLVSEALQWRSNAANMGCSSTLRSARCWSGINWHHLLKQQLRGWLRRGGVLAGDKLTIDQYVGLPVVGFGEDPTKPLEFVLDEEGDDLGEPHRLLLAIGEPCNVHTFDQRAAVGLAHM